MIVFVRYVCRHTTRVLLSFYYNSLLKVLQKGGIMENFKYIINYYKDIYKNNKNSLPICPLQMILKDSPCSRRYCYQCTREYYTRSDSYLLYFTK